jgi:hypothetical protein
MSNKDYNDGLDTAASIVEEMLRGTSEGETILCGIESSKKDMSDEILYSETDVKKMIQKALQDNHLNKHEKICDLDWLLYRIRLGGGCIRMFANINALFRSNETLPRERFKEFEEEFIKNINEEYDSNQR